jgi:hypothetical protein
MNNKIVFLDIDGVLNNTMYWHQAKEQKETRHDIDVRNVLELNKLTDNSDVAVVISSTWRLSHTVDEIRNILNEYKFKGNIIDKTVRFRENGIVRGNEIHEWVIRNDVTQYVILDDDSDMLLWQAPHFIKVDGYVGLTPTNVYKAQWILDNVKYV